MLTAPLPDLENWVLYFSNNELPILRQTERKLAAARLNIDRISGRELSEIILQDPLMTIRVLSYIQPFRGKHLRTDITTIDMNVEEVALAALLHDLAEILLWCFAPRLALEIRNRQQADPDLRSMIAQEDVLGIRLADLQLALCQGWNLPELLKTLMDDAHAEHPRVRNVVLAVNLARHSAQSWENPGLPDDFRGVEKLLHVDRDILLKRLQIPDHVAQRYLSPPETPSTD